VLFLNEDTLEIKHFICNIWCNLLTKENYVQSPLDIAEWLNSDEPEEVKYSLKFIALQISWAYSVCVCVSVLHDMNVNKDCMAILCQLIIAVVLYNDSWVWEIEIAVSWKFFMLYTFHLFWHCLWLNFRLSVELLWNMVFNFLRLKKCLCATN
jgi:hypothetical protein